MRNYTSLASVFVLALSANLASANNYSFELNADLGRIDLEDSGFGDEKVNETNVSGTWYFNGVNIRNHPLAEAAFLERASSLSLAHHNSRWKFNDEIYLDDLYLGDGSVTDTLSVTLVDVDFYIPNSIFYVGGSISEGRNKIRYKITTGGETETGSFSESTGSFWTLRAGVAPVQGLLIWSEFFKDQEFSDEWNINAKYVMDWSGNALNLEASYDKTLYEKTIQLAADYYFDKTFSLGAVFEDSDAWDTSYGLRARKFFTDSFAVEGSYLIGEDSDSYRLGVSLRF